MQEVITRISPSPTGNLHIGTARSALFNYLYAKSVGGKFLVRIEDTDKERSEEKYERDILSSLERLSLIPDEIIKQSTRINAHKDAIKTLIEKGRAYTSLEEQNGKENEVIRFKNPNEIVKFNDTLRGDISIDTTDLGDFIIARNMDSPLYHLAVVVDDEYSNITNIIRGDDHISNTPRQILLQRALEYKTPIYTHIPLISDMDGKKLSKRRNATSISEFLDDEKILPEALINFIALMGWHPTDEREFFTLEDLVGEFSLDRLQKGNARCDLVKLHSVNAYYIKNQTFEKFQNEFSETNNKYVLEDLKEKIKTYKEGHDLLSAGEYAFFDKRLTLQVDEVTFKDNTRDETKQYIKGVVDILKSHNEKWVATEIKSKVMPYAEENGRANVLWPTRYSLTYSKKSPDPFLVAEALGKEETIKRLEIAMEQL